MANEKTPVVWDDTTKKHRPLGTGEKMGGLDASSLLSSDSGNLLEAGSDGLAYLSGSGVVDPRADNLLEESDRGKLQVTVDRIAEWLDGHPQDAAVLADAINVVSGDSGNVIVEGTDKGAFLSKGAISAAVAGMTDAQKAQLADAIAARIASDVADGKTIVASGGKLTADPTNATAAQKKAINQALADADSGLVVNNSTGKLQVDFSQMPTDKFEALLEGLKMQIPLESNLDLWVATNGVDAEGRGTQAQPFATLAYCVTYATQKYALGTRTITIHMKAGSYLIDPTTLPTFTRTSGRIVIVSEDGYEAAVLSNRSGGQNMLLCTGGQWVLRGLKVINHTATPTDGINHFYSCLSATNGGDVYIESCSMDARYVGSEVSTRVGVSCLNIALNSSVHFTYNSMGPNKFHTEAGDETGQIFIISQNSSVYLHRNNADASSDGFKIYFSGDMSPAVSLDAAASIQVYGGAANSFQFGVLPGGSLTGRGYALNGGSFVRLAGSTTLPEGTVTPTVDTSTYCWVN